MRADLPPRLLSSLVTGTSSSSESHVVILRATKDLCPDPTRAFTLTTGQNDGREKMDVG